MAAEVEEGGVLGEHKGINLPGVAVSAPALTEQDRRDLVTLARAAGTTVLVDETMAEMSLVFSSSRGNRSLNRSLAI